MTTLNEFLLARIAEDEAFLSSASARDARDCQECAFASDYEPTPYRLARLLAECEAKRRVVERATTDAYLTLLALPYADHPDYDEEWRP